MIVSLAVILDLFVSVFTKACLSIDGCVQGSTFVHDARVSVVIAGAVALAVAVGARCRGAASLGGCFAVLTGLLLLAWLVLLV
jgi:hypothetical protein